MAWIWLGLAGLCEVAGVMGISRWNRTRNAANFLLMGASFLLSFFLLSVAMQEIALGTAYAIWTAIGTVGGAIVGMIRFGEPRSFTRMIFIAMIVCAAAGLKLVG